MPCAKFNKISPLRVIRSVEWITTNNLSHGHYTENMSSRKASVFLQRNVSSLLYASSDHQLRYIVLPVYPDNSESYASELLENPEEMFLRYFWQ